MNIEVQQEQSQGLSMMNMNEKDTALLYLQETMVNKTKMLVHIWIKNTHTWLISRRRDCLICHGDCFVLRGTLE